MSLSIAITRVMPVLLPATRESVHALDVAMSAVKPIVDKLAFLATMADHEGEKSNITLTCFQLARI